MQPTRREFMRGVGVMLASLLTTRCVSRPTYYVPPPPTRTPTPMPTCYTVVPTATPTPAAKKEDWDSLRAPWHDLDRLARDAHDMERGEKTRDRLIADHQAALDRLAQVGGLDPVLADDMQAAFEGAAYHVWRANAPITCYVPAPYPDYQVESSSDLAMQADLLAEMAETSAIDEATVTQAQAAIERDVAFLSMSAQEKKALVEAVMQGASGSGDFPALAQLDMDIPPESAAAARILVELLIARE